MANREIIMSEMGIDVHPNVKTIGVVYVDDFDYLVKAEGQRNQGDNIDLVESINNYGMCTAPIVIKENNKYTVVDGWHRVTACRKINTPLMCLIVETDCTVQELMVALNTTMINWRPKDFLNFGIVFHKNPDYILLDKIWRDTGISLVALYEILSKDVRNNNKRKTSFEKGAWKMTTKDLGMKTIEYGILLQPFIPFSTNSNFLRGFVTCVGKKAFDFGHLLVQVKKYTSKIHDGDKPNQHSQMLNLVYNLNTPEIRQVYIA